MQRKKKDNPRDFATEADLCAEFIKVLPEPWVAYPETGGWDIVLLQRETGVQIGVEAKLRLNADVITQALEEYQHRTFGPDYRAVLVPYGSGSWMTIAQHLGITVIHLSDLPQYQRRRHFYPALPTDDWPTEWHNELPTQRIKLPEYVPDVRAGVPAPSTLSHWKIQALKIAILLEERPVHKSDFKHIGIDHRRWTTPGNGWLVATRDGFVKGPFMPDFKGQHPRNFEEIKADRPNWDPGPPVWIGTPTLF